MRLNNITEITFYEKLKDIKLFMFDLEGVLLNNIDDEDKLFHRMTQFSNLLAAGDCYTGIITARKKDNLTAKFDEIENCFVLASSMNKMEKMEEKLLEMKIGFIDIFYIGDDILDIPLLQKVGLSCAPSNGRREVKRAVDAVLDEMESLDILKTLSQFIGYSNGNNEDI